MQDNTELQYNCNYCLNSWNMYVNNLSQVSHFYQYRKVNLTTLLKSTFHHMFETQFLSDSTPGYCFGTLITFAGNYYGVTKQYKTAYRILMRIS